MRRHATPAFWLRDHLGRCEAGPWLCWRRSEVTWPLPACARHNDAALLRLARAIQAVRDSQDQWRTTWAEFVRHVKEPVEL